MGAKGWLHNDAFIRHWGNLTYSVTVASFSINCTTQYASWKDRTQLVKAHEHKHTQKKKIPWSLKLTRRQGVSAIHSMGLQATKKKDWKDTISMGTHVPKVFSLQLFYTGCYHFPLERPVLGPQPGHTQNASLRVLPCAGPRAPINATVVSGRASNTKTKNPPPN